MYNTHPREINCCALCRALRDAERGLIAVEPGGGVIKQRIARPGKGKSGGFRTPIVGGAVQPIHGAV
jgi:hypothetical protein